MNILIVLFSVQILLFCALFLVVKHIYNSLKSGFMASEDGKPSAFAQLVETISEVFARSIVTQAKTTFMGVSSGQSRGEQAVAADMAEDAIANQSPLLAGVLKQFPRLSKSLRRNPQLIDFALSKLLSKSPNNNGNHDENSQVPKFKL